MSNQLLRQLAASSPQVRRDVTTELFHGMAAADPLSTLAFKDMVMWLVNREQSSPVFAQECFMINNLARSRGMFSAHGSVDLLDSVPRVSGFLNAIKREPSPATVIDAGTGSSALLGLGAAVFHGAEVLAIEMNPAAAQCASKVVELSGFSKQVKVVHGDALSLDVPPVDLTVTETFAEALTKEPSPKIIHRLGALSKRVLPRYAKIYAKDAPDDDKPWQMAALVDLTEPKDRVSGSFTSVGTGYRNVRAWAGLYNEEGVPVLATYKDDLVTSCAKLGSIGPSVVMGDTLEFSYQLGAGIAEATATLQSISMSDATHQ